MDSCPSSSSHPCSPSPSSLAHAHFSESYTSSMQQSVSLRLPWEDDSDPPYTFCTRPSPSPDMEEALIQHLSTASGDSEPELINVPPVSFDDPVNVLIVDPFLDYLNELLMEEQGDRVDVPCSMQHDDVVASYNAIVSSLYEIIGERLPLDSASSHNFSGSDVMHESVSSLQSSHLDADATESCSGLSILTGEHHVLGVSSNSLVNPAYGNFDVSLKQKKAGDGTLYAMLEGKVQNFSSQAHETGPVETDHVSEWVAAGTIGDLSFNNGLKGQDQDQQPSNVDLTSSNDPSTAKPGSLVDQLSLEDFKVKAGYDDLYVTKPSLSNISTSIIGTASSLNEGKTKSSRVAKKKCTEVVSFVDWRDLLVTCAHAVGMGDVREASEILQQLYGVHGASVQGNGLQRTAHYFGDALIARMGGMGGHQYRVLGENRPSVVSFLRAAKMWYGVTPYMKIMHYFANQSILKAAEGALRLHILDYGIAYGMHWPCLINALADREGGPPLLVITGIDSSKRGLNSSEWLEENGRRLAEYAKTYNVPFHFYAVVSDRWDDIDPASLHLQEGEILVINCMKRLLHQADESLDPTCTMSLRQKVLASMHSLNPHLLLISETNSAGTLPFFISRFREALYYYSNIMNMLDTLYGVDSERLVMETKCYARDILNLVACEGAERVERPETYKQWDLRIRRAGFELLPVPSVILSRSRSHVKQHHHKDFVVDEDANGWMLLGWKGRIILVMSAWKPAAIF
ncbi:hypothetical protein L7F22_047019 [Adiantum nelumboides]|nr:hypothetical protein [Adiantum nelumboides]